MLIYNYNEDGFFTTRDTADESPLEPGTFLVPAMSTTLAPPKLLANQWAMFNGEEWLVVELTADTSAGDAYEERQWRNKELNRADNELNKVQDGVGVGTVSVWRAYRVLLRNWPAHASFPNPDYRPLAPDAV